MGAMRFEAVGRSHVGMVREHNEDALLLVPEQRLFVVADGMGGHASGEVASEIAVQTLSEFFHATGAEGNATWPSVGGDDQLPREANRLVAGIKLANTRILQRAAAEERLRGMGTTLAAALLDGPRIWIAWAGDSRVYRSRGGKLTQLSEDHSLLNDYIRLRNPTAEEIAGFPHKHVIVRALGMKSDLTVDVIGDDPQDADIYLLCSDGLSGMITDDRIQGILEGATDLEVAAGQLIDAANAAGGTDNITVLLVRCRP
jgi:serine/threonine protein phosphatase PrpC